MTEGRRTATAAAGRGSPTISSTEGDRLLALEARLERLEGAPGLRARGRGLMAKVVPPEATQHFRNAGREQLLGVRSIVDFWIERLDEADERSGSGGRHESIEID
jgi:hypothetical protein